MNELPLLAAALIVRDEARSLPDCLASLAGVVDEVHVHDTGSVDGTPDLAARLGAQVTTGPWTDDFAAARNAAQAGWAAHWVLVVDADDRIRSDAGRLRDLLSASRDSDVLDVDVDVDHDTNPYTFRQVRLYRPGRVSWSGRVHEVLVGADGRPARSGSVPRDVLSLRHVGYGEARVRVAKARRNLDLARADLDALTAAGTGTDPARAARTLLDLGRSLVAAERRQDAVDTFETLRELFPGTPEWLHATDFLARVLLGAGLHEAVLVLVEQLRTAGAGTGYCDWLAAQALAHLGDVEGAHRLLSGVHEVVDTAGRRYRTELVQEMRALVEQLRATPVSRHAAR